MLWLGTCSKGLSSLVVFENGTVDHNEVLPVALKYWNSIFGNDGTFHQDGAKPHTVMKKLRNGLSTVFLRSHWPPNHPGLNPLDYCLWDELDKTIKSNRVTPEKSIIVELKRAVKEVLCLKVARLRLIDATRRGKLFEIIKTTIFVEN